MRERVVIAAGLQELRFPGYIQKMKKIVIVIFLLAISLFALAQDKIEKKTTAIVKEGKLLYRSEMASWYGTDIFLEKLKSRGENVGGYFSYTNNNLSKCIFFSKGDYPRVIGSIAFDSSYNVSLAIVDSTERDFTTEENGLYTIRKKALTEIETDTLFKTYKNTNLNLIPLISDEEKKVYVLTGPQINGVIIFGNDYLLTFDKNNNLKNKKKLHQNIIITDFAEAQSKNDSIIGAMHTHLPSTGDFITPTDICTLMLYEKFVEWDQYIVVSDDYVSIWNCKTDQLLAIKKDVWNKIDKDQKQRHPEK